MTDTTTDESLGSQTCPASVGRVQRLLNDGICTVTPCHPQFVSKVGQ
jgi:hypothetical protein